jgi:dipeptide transport system substrate-binding protein
VLARASRAYHSDPAAAPRRRSPSSLIGMPMPLRTFRAAAAVAVVVFAAGASSAAFAAKTLVYCSEGSPEGFNPQFFTTGTTADASSVPIYNRLVEFEIGTTNVVPGLAESWTASPDGLSYTFKLRRGVKFHSNSRFTPTRTTRSRR